MTNEELKQKIQEDEKRDFREYAERELYLLNILRDMLPTSKQAEGSLQNKRREELGRNERKN